MTPTKLLQIVALLFFPFLMYGQMEQPNILWIVSEDNSPFIGAYGDEFATTPNIDQMAREGILYENAFASAPVCAPARSTLITGVYPPSMGTQHMRSRYPIPDMIRFFPEFLKKAGYYTTNNSKTDYNTSDAEDRIPFAWDESSGKATYENKNKGQPFFAVFNIGISHESSIHKSMDELNHDPDEVPIPPYHPETPEMKHDWAQYYDKVQAMDARVGEILRELEESGYADNTIVFYYSDHGGILGRSKRFMFDSGLHVPLVIRFPEKYREIAPGGPGTRTDRLVSFVDFAPTVLSLAGVPIPQYMQGKAFLGSQEEKPREYAYSFRGRMDERIDMSRTVRDKKYRYIRNYLPHKIYGQYLGYLWRAPSMRSWEREYQAGNLDEIQSQFWNPKPVEELFDIEADPHNVNNLAKDPAYKSTLNRMRKANEKWMKRIRDVGFIPEAMLSDLASQVPLYDYSRSGDYPIANVNKIVGKITRGDKKTIEKNLTSENPVLRYWAATGVTMYIDKVDISAEKVRGLMNDEYPAVRIAAAEALFHLGESGSAVTVLAESMEEDNLMARVQAINVLETMGEEARPAVPAVQEIIPEDDENRDYDVRAARRLVDKLQ
ncbi:sulfatase-like hydrolase/transferase [Membranihabitans maritimus]|uniref:sulfatase-like hydrolase/transferase n=1 Tax=Membranihabitans maritimus TaxID=2904244 RepID=UPI001EFFF8CA|nr:sulfatase-like hydrolase/transferase [Membranihabitans maritimus]